MLGFDQIVPLGIVALFGGLILWWPIGFLIGRRFGGLAGTGVAMMLFGLTGCCFAAWLAWHVWHDTTVVVLPRIQCETVPPTPDMSVQRMRSRDVHELTLTQAAGRWRLVTEPSWDPCSEEARSSRLRYRKADLVPGAVEVTARVEPDARQAPMLVGVFGAFGGFGLLGGLIVSLTAARERGALRPVPDPDAPALPPWRRHTARGFIAAGNLGLMGTAMLALFAEEHFGGVLASTHIVFKAVGLACACWIVGMALRRTLRIEALLTFVLIGGAFWLAAASLRLMEG